MVILAISIDVVHGSSVIFLLLGGIKHALSLQVRGLLNSQEVLMSKTIGYLKGVHVLVATPDNLAEVLRFPEFRSLFDDLKAIAIDEVDACFKVVLFVLLHCRVSV